VIPGAVSPHVLKPTTVPGHGAEIVDMDLGYHHRCALIDGGDEVKCWGLNTFHQLGVTYTRHSHQPVRVRHARDVIAVRGGWDRTCILTLDRDVKCWGGLDPDFDVDMHQGEVFDIPSLEPRQVRGMEKAQAVSMQTSHGCAVGEDRILSCFGKNSAAALGPDTSHDFRLEARAFVELGVIRAFDVGSFHTCVIRHDRALWCWGGINGQVGSEARVQDPRRIEGLQGVEAVASGGSQTCARHEDKRVLCWGEDLVETSRGLYDEEHLIEIPDFEGAVELSAGADHVCARFDDGAVRCLGGLPVHGPQGMMVPHPPHDKTFAIEGFEDVVQLASGDGFVCARSRAGTVYCMGRNEDGQLGDGTDRASTRAVEVDGLDGVVDIGAGRAHACAVVESGAVFCWGANLGMQLGIEEAYSVEGRMISQPGETIDVKAQRSSR
ncbi:MAG: RCC1 domain-containing protein, partial [Bradymonadaceae bacterium]